ncbi:aldolase [candidate division KSB1 bacterium]|nr:aldolase [candidate division KSB1 bacterium]
MTGSEFNSKLHRGELLLGTAITTASPYWGKLSQELGLDFVFIDNEHHPFSREQIAMLCQLMTACGIVPVVRILRPDPALASAAIDAGALAVVAPYVERIAEAQELVGAVKFGPLKGDLLNRGLSQNDWIPEAKQYLDERNQHRSVILNIESVPALEKLDELAAVPGVDALLIGPHDLSISLGLPEAYEHPIFREKLAHIIRTARAHNLGAGIHSWSTTEDEKEWIGMGLNLLVHWSDYQAAKVKLGEDLKTLRKESILMDKKNDLY